MTAEVVARGFTVDVEDGVITKRLRTVQPIGTRWVSVVVTLPSASVDDRANGELVARAHAQARYLELYGAEGPIPWDMVEIAISHTTARLAYELAVLPREERTS